MAMLRGISPPSKPGSSSAQEISPRKPVLFDAEPPRQPAVEGAGVLSHARGVPPVAVLGVEVHEVREDQAALEAPQRLQDRIYLRAVVGRGREVLCDAPAVEDVPDLADRHNRQAGV